MSLTSHSSIFSSEVASGCFAAPDLTRRTLREAAVADRLTAAKGRRTASSFAERLALWRQRMPMGAVVACAIVGCVHLALSTIVYPSPVARQRIREKVIALTQDTSPRLIIAGDSRADRQLVPLALAAELGWSGADVANIGVHTCASTGARAAYREFADRFSPAPVMVISISFWSVNDNVPSVLPEDEILWELGLWDRLKLTSPREALSATFLPEKRLLDLEERSMRLSDGVPGNRGFEWNAVSAWHNFTSDSVHRQIDWLLSNWYVNPKLDGIRWRQLEEDLVALRTAGVQVVLFDGPTHPDLHEVLSDCPAERAQITFQQRMDELARRLEMPLLRYENDWYAGFEAREVYFDLAHVNYIGAHLLSRRVGADLAALFDSHALIEPVQAKETGKPF